MVDGWKMGFMVSAYLGPAVEGFVVVSRIEARMKGRYDKVLESKPFFG